MDRPNCEWTESGSCGSFPSTKAAGGAEGVLSVCRSPSRYLIQWDPPPPPPSSLSAGKTKPSARKTISICRFGGGGGEGESCALGGTCCDCGKELHSNTLKLRSSLLVELAISINYHLAFKVILASSRCYIRDIVNFRLLMTSFVPYDGGPNK